MGNEAKEKAGPGRDRELDEEKLSGGERTARKGWACRKRRKEPKEILKSISASLGKIRYRESWSLHERARVSK